MQCALHASEEMSEINKRKMASRGQKTFMQKSGAIHAEKRRLHEGNNTVRRTWGTWDENDTFLPYGVFLIFRGFHVFSVSKNDALRFLSYPVSGSPISTPSYFNAVPGGNLAFVAVHYRY